MSGASTSSDVLFVRYAREYQVVMHTPCLNAQQGFFNVLFFFSQNIHLFSEDLRGLEGVVYSLDVFNLVVDKIQAWLHVFYFRVKCIQQVNFLVNGL